MKFEFNPFTGNFDIVGSSTGSGSTFNVDDILTGPSEDLYASSAAPLEVLVDNNGNVLTGE